MPREPPVAVNVLELPEHIEVGFAEAPVGGVEAVLTFTVTLAQDVVLQVPSALT